MLCLAYLKDSSVKQAPKSCGATRLCCMFRAEIKDTASELFGASRGSENVICVTFTLSGGAVGDNFKTIAMLDVLS